MAKKPTRVAQCTHFDDFMEFKRETRERLGKIDDRMDRTDERVGIKFDRHEARMDDLEKKSDGLESSMEQFKTALETVSKAIIGDIDHPEKPGMAEDVRSLKGTLDKLVRMHEDEAKEKAREAREKVKEAEKEVKESKTHPDIPTIIKSDDKKESPDIPWKAITIALGIIGGLVAIIWKILPLIISAD